jgi:hypothetical protein
MPADQIDDVTIGFDEIPSLKGREFRGDWFQIDRDRLALFDHAIYSDDNAPAVGDVLYPDGMVEGFHLIGLLDHLMHRILRIRRDEWFGWNYGLDRVRFVTPVTVDKPVRLRFTVADVIPRGDGYLLLLDSTLELPDTDRPAMVAEWRVYWLPRPSRS